MIGYQYSMYDKIAENKKIFKLLKKKEKYNCRNSCKEGGKNKKKIWSLPIEHWWKWRNAKVRNIC